MNIIDHLDTPHVHFKDCPAHEVIVQQNPAWLIDEGWVPLGPSRDNKDRVILDPKDFLPRNKLGRLAPAVLYVNTLGLRIGVLEGKRQICDLADAIPDLSRAD